MLDPSTAAQLEEHLSKCESCQQLLYDVAETVNILKEAEDVELPDNFHEELVARLGHSAKPKKYDFGKLALLSKAAGYAAAAFIAVSLAAVGIYSVIDNRSQPPVNPVLENQQTSESLFSTQSPTVRDLQIAAAAQPNTQPFTVTTFNINLQVDDIEKAVEFIEKSSGSIQSLDYSPPINEYSGGYANISKRVNQGEYEQTKMLLRELGTVTSENEQSQNRARDIFSVNAQLNAKKAEMERIIELFENSTFLEGINQISGLLSAVTDEHDALYAQQRDLNSQVDQPYINIYIETRRISAPQPARTLGDRLALSFVRSFNGTIAFMQNFIIAITSKFLQIIIIAGLAIFVVFLVRKIRRRGGRL
jgi:hypothetical protein